MSTTNRHLKPRTIRLNQVKDHNSPEWLRSFPGCEHYTDEEATDIINSIDTFADILLENAAHKLQYIDNQNVIDLNNSNEHQKEAA